MLTFILRNNLTN